jgi:hypothetical protein
MFSGRPNGSGFWITFDNGIRVSMQWGQGMYVKDRSGNDYTKSENAEVAALDPDGQMITSYILTLLHKNSSEFDDVSGHLNADEVLEFLNYASILTENDIYRNKQIQKATYDKLRKDYAAGSEA